jgi:hypothetical protein
MKRLLCLYFLCGAAIDTFSQCSPTISLIGSPLSESPTTFPTSRIGLDYASSELLIDRPGLITIAIANANSCSSWQLSVSRLDNTTNTDLQFWVNKTNDGSSSTSGASISPSGLTTFQEIQTYSQNFFSGVKNRTSIQISYKIIGISVNRRASTYSTTVYYTISGTL